MVAGNYTDFTHLWGLSTTADNYGNSTQVYGRYCSSWSTGAELLEKEERRRQTTGPPVTRPPPVLGTACSCMEMRPGAPGDGPGLPPECPSST